MSTKPKTWRSEKKQKTHWSESLVKAIENPNLIVFEDDLAVVINDAYPKAKIHYLVCPKENIPTLKSVEAKHLNLLQHMHRVATDLCNKHKEKEFLIGYHSVPSMVRLHLHVISTDFDSPCLKTKKHWNSFTTEFFLASEKVIQELAENGKLSHKIISDSKNLIKQSLKCHKCSYRPKNMPDLKGHLKIHQNYSY